MTATLGLAEAALPDVFREADETAVRSQRIYLRVIKAQIAGLLVPVVAGTADGLISGRQPTLAIISLISLTLVAVTRLMQRFSGYESTWHSARAIAETIRSLSWQYAVGSSAFAGVTDEEASKKLTSMIDSVSVARNEGSSGSQREATGAMTGLRRADISDRKAAYASARLGEQISWYRAKAETARHRGRIWDWLFVSCAGLAVAFGVLQVTGALEIGLVSLFGLTAAVIGTWTGVNQFGSIEATYTNAADELLPYLEAIDDVVDSQWPGFVTDCEGVMAREHQLWLVRRS